MADTRTIEVRLTESKERLEKIKEIASKYALKIKEVFKI
jgi:DNA repair ATPase RecN